MANNHSMDYGANGYASTLAVLEQAGVPYVERDSTAVVTTGSGLTIGLYAAVYYKLDVADMTAKIAALREQGVEQIQFVTSFKTTTLSVEDLLAEGGSWFALEHNGLVSRQLSAAQAESLKCRMH